MASSWLVAGVTASVIDPQLSSVWAAVVHQMAREVGGQVVGGVEPPGPGRNHYRLALELPEVGPVWILLNAAVRLVGCQLRTQPSALGLPFRDVPRRDLFELVDFRVGSQDEFERPLDENQLVDLTPSELADVKYHRPARLGDVIYNWFD
jgi:hypothetical protein